MTGNVISLQNMFLNADPVVKAVMVLLLVASLFTWAIILEKIFVLGRQERAARRLKRLALAEDSDLEDLPGLPGQIVSVGLTARRRNLGSETAADFRARVEGAMRLVLAERLERLSRRSLFLASVGSTSPFVGLFGTVWGIMNSFIGIASSGETTLAVVAPGIAEALFATAMGLVAAIPAVLGYNMTVGRLKRITRQAMAAISLLGQRLAWERFQPINHKPES
ncbi:MAG: MotA/TolQ/ExbB proton channel family protein [Deltaproteobacteria bacterium]|jgi:biopolymer transport protein ExbB/TolQ|nr:MotA/TolQ/ExbB proton channel family protein [Deltaproteobacteria bacterium]